MTPRMLSAWNELIMREEVRKGLREANHSRVAQADQKAWQEWVKNQMEEQK